MRSLFWIGVVTALTFGCGTNQEDGVANPISSDDPEAQGSGDPDGSPTGTPSPTGACAMPSAPGSVLARVQLSPTGGGAVLAATVAGEVVYTTATGIAKLDAQLAPVYEYPHGSVVALDAQGNAYVAGGFTAPTDFGTGVIEPMGNIDVFLAKLSPAGDVLSATALGLCGDGVQSIAVDAHGRIAISGTAIGTVVLDATGAMAFVLDVSGKVAFDSHGNLIIGGTVAGTAGDTDALLTKVDATGALVFEQRYGDAPLPLTFGGFGGPFEVTTPRDQAIASVAVGPNDEIALVGEFRYEMDLLGQTQVNGPSFPSGSEAGLFVVKLDASGTPVFGVRALSANASLPVGGLRMIQSRLDPGTAVAINAHGDVVVSSNTPGNPQGPFAFPQLTVFDGQTGAPGFSLGNETGTVGYGLGIGLDGCGNLIWATFLNEPSIFEPHTFITKVAP
jgi:hypothetical protein